VTSRLDAARALLGRSPLVDGHNDLAWELREAGSQDLGTTDLARPVGSTHTDLPRLAEGRVGAQFWSVYVPVSLAGMRPWPPRWSRSTSSSAWSAAIRAGWNWR
jgi:membrane dipeptidase